MNSPTVSGLLSDETTGAIVSKLREAGVLIPMRFQETEEVGSVALLLGLCDFDRHWANALVR